MHKQNSRLMDVYAIHDRRSITNVNSHSYYSSQLTNVSETLQSIDSGESTNALCTRESVYMNSDKPSQTKTSNYASLDVDNSALSSARSSSRLMRALKVFFARKVMRKVSTFYLVIGLMVVLAATLVTSMLQTPLAHVKDLEKGQVPSLVEETLSLGLSGSLTSFPSFSIEQKSAFVTQDKTLCKHYVFDAQAERVQAVACFRDGRWSNTMIEPLVPSATDKPGSLHLSSIDRYIRNDAGNKFLKEPQERAFLKEIQAGY